MTKKKVDTETGEITEAAPAPIVARGVNQFETLNVDYDPPCIKLGKEQPNFLMPDGSLATSVQGHIVYAHGIRQYHDEQFSPSDPKPPVCSSSDKIHPDGGTNPMPCKNCAECDLFLIQGKDDNGYSCKERTIVLFLPDGDVVPNLINLSPTNLSSKVTHGIKKWFGLARAMTARANLGDCYSAVHVELTLELKEFGGGANSVLNIRSLGLVETQEQYDRVFDLWQEATNKSQSLVSQVDLRDDGAAEADGIPV